MLKMKIGEVFKNTVLFNFVMCSSYFSNRHEIFTRLGKWASGNFLAFAV